MTSRLLVPSQLAPKMYNEYAFPAFAGIAFLLLLIPFPLQVRSGNLALIFYMGWLIIITLTYFVNSIQWANNVTIVNPVWCDICE